MIHVACMHRARDNENGKRILVDNHREIRIADNKGSIWVEIGYQNDVLPPQLVVLSHETAGVLAHALASRLGGVFARPVIEEVA